MKDVIKPILIMLAVTTLIFVSTVVIYFVSVNWYQNYQLTKAKTNFFNKSSINVGQPAVEVLNDDS